MSMFPLRYRYKIKERPKTGDWAVQVFDDTKLLQVLFFSACNSALSYVERKEGCHS